MRNPSLHAISIIVLSVAAWIAPPADARTPHTAFMPKIGSIVPTSNAAALAQMLVGPGVTIANAVYTGSPQAAGTFAGGGVSVGIPDGIILSTGRAIDAIGPNQFDSTSTAFGLPGDTTLDALVAPNTTQDAAILEFDVTTAESSMAIRFVFASEEYNEFVNTDFNDVIGIFVNGVNCANYGGKPVNVNSINAGSNPGLFIDNTTGARNTEMDGLTIPLDCVASVNPNVPNHVRIAIADTSDGIYDAAVFLAAGGVRAPASGPPTTSNLLKAIEYYHAVFNHYFITTIPAEIASLDTGALSKDWTRTGRAFNVSVAGTAATVPVCRFFSTSFAPRSSHFYTPSASECAIVKANPNWLFEAEVFNIALPLADGSCTTGTQPLYRLYNNGMGGAPNHRYTTDLLLRADMLAAGWIPEGAGVGVVGCVPL